MKYNINLNQKALSEESIKMDLIDASILEYIKDMCGSVNEKVRAKRFEDEEHNIWTWIDLARLLKEMPILRIKSRGAVSRRLKTIEEEGFLSTKIKSDGGHPRLFVKLEKKIERLTFTNINVESEVTLTKDNVHVDLNQREVPSHVDIYQPMINIIQDNKHKDYGGDLPDWLDKEAWADWNKFRKQLNKGAMTEMTVKRQLKLMEQHKENHVAMINQSITMGYTGLFPVKGQTKNTLPSGVPYTKGKYADDKSIEIKN